MKEADSNQAEALYARALAAYDAGERQPVVDLAFEAMARYPRSPEAKALRLLLAQGYEFGDFGEYALEEARDLYRGLADSSIGEPESLVGAARTLFRIDAQKNQDEIVRLCDRAIQRHDNVHAKMILGRLHERVRGEVEPARRMYLAAYRQGLPWGLRFLAQSYARQGFRLRAGILFLITSLTSPFLVMRHGVRGPFSRRAWIYDLGSSTTTQRSEGSL